MPTDLRSNNFDALRIAAAALVLFSHCFPLFGREPEAVAALTGYETGGGFAVATFFFISGFLLTGSLAASGNLRVYAMSRALRILPGLAGATLFGMFVIGPLMTRLALDEYFAHAATWSYLGNALIFPLQFALPGVFETNPHPGSVNGALWTLPIEAAMYLVLPLLFFTGALRRQTALFVPAAFFAVLMIAKTVYGLGWQDKGPVFLISVPLYNFLELGLFYFIGAAYRIYADRIPVDGRLATVALVLWIATFHSPIGYAAYLLTIPYLTYYVAFCPLSLRGVTSWTGDISYGFYIYAFPVQQTVYALFAPSMGFWTMMVVAFAVTTVLAWLSSVLIERPALALKPILSRRLARAPA